MLVLLSALLILQQPIMPAEPVTIQVGSDAAALVYSSAGDEIINIAARDLTEDGLLDLMIEVRRGPTHIAYHDVDAAPALENLLLAMPGDYVIHVHTFNGVQTGAVEVTMTTQPRLAPCAAGEINLSSQTPYRCQLELRAGQPLTLTVRDSSGTLDPLLRLFDVDGDLLALNDDHGIFSTTLNVLDAALIDYPVSVTGSYIVQVSDFSGAAGTFELSLDHDG